MIPLCRSQDPEAEEISGEQHKLRIVQGFPGASHFKPVAAWSYGSTRRKTSFFETPKTTTKTKEGK